ncbi:MAG TPA: NrdJb, partial [Oleiagrimonas sp.]|nr:NrdJb [Oleiagrimonas sp.]
MTIKIDKKIKAYQVLKQEQPQAEKAPPVAKPAAAEVIQMHESLERPQTLIGATYKIKSPLFEHALYVTINDIVLNAGTPYEQRRPFEIFINSKNMDHFQWIVALTRIMSAVFRKGGDVTFLVEEMKAVFDPRGGYFKAGGVYMPSIVAEIGAVIEQHMKRIGLIHDPEMSDSQRALIAEKRAAYEAASAKKNSDTSSVGAHP